MVQQNLIFPVIYTAILFYCHTIYTLKVYTSMAFSIFKVVQPPL